MIYTINENHNELELGKDISDISVVDFETIKTIEAKIFNIINEDRKLDNPVFLFIQDNIISKLSYFMAGYIRRPIAIGVAGETASGKSTFALDVLQTILDFQEKYALPPVITRVNTDDYYYDRSEDVKAAGGFANFAKNYDFDVPDAFELDLLKYHIEQLVLGNKVMLPKYDMSGTAIRYNNHTPAEPNPLIITEGLFCLTDKVKDVFDFSIYVDVSTDTQKERFFRRASERGLGDAAQRVYDNAVEKGKIYVKPTAANADIIVNGEASREDYRDVTSKFIEILKFVRNTRVIANNI